MERSLKFALYNEFIFFQPVSLTMPGKIVPNLFFEVIMDTTIIVWISLFTPQTIAWAIVCCNVGKF